MSVRPVTYFQFVCDFPECGKTAQEDGEYAAWGEPEGAREDATNGDWHVHPDTDLGYCPRHPARWACDLADGDEPPGFPLVVLDAEGAPVLVATPQDLLEVLDRLRREDNL